MRAPGIMQAARGVKSDGLAASVYVKVVRRVVAASTVSMVLMDGKEKANSMRALLVAQVLINEPKEGEFVKQHGGKETTPESPGDRAVCYMVKRVHLGATKETRGVALPKPVGCEPPMKTSPQERH